MPNRTTSEAVGTRLDRLAWKPIHTWITLALGIGWLLDAFEVNVVGNVLGVLRDLWHLSDSQASAIVSVWLVGLMIGALFFGYLADRFGRRKLFLITLLLYSCATVISALSPGYWFFLVFRFLTAIGVGAEYSAINAAIGELIPARYRGRANATVMNFWPLGTILAAAITLYFIHLFPPSIGWRFAFALGAIIALFTLWVRRVLPESPRWLFAKGRKSEAGAILDSIEKGAARFPAGVAANAHDDARIGSPGFWSQLRCLLRDHPGRIALGCALDFTEAAGYYGIFAFLPLVVLPHVGVGQRNVPLFFLVGNIGAVAGGILAAAFLDRVGRKATVTSFYVLAALSMLGMGVATIGGNARGVLCAFIVVNFCSTGSWISAYPTFSEIFPTPLRSTGIGASVAFGRIGAALAPPLLVFLSHKVSPMTAFAVLAGFYALGASTMVPWWIWGPEGRGCPLEVLAGEKSS
jgi:MFS family permease